MLILGLAGGFDPAFDSRFNFSENFLHDAAAVIVRDGRVIAGIEEERLNRIKHSNKIWAGSVRFCLEQAKARFEDLDHVAIYAGEEFLDRSLKYLCLHFPGASELLDARGMFQKLFRREFGWAPERDRFRFVHHHIAHAASAFHLSGFPESLILTVDGAGDDISTMVLDARGGRLSVLKTKPVEESLGFYYLDVIRFLGYKIFDEYKVMGLAPYGDAARFQSLFDTFYSLLPEGDFALHRNRIFDLYGVTPPRRRGEPFNQIHKDIAAALQASLETIVLHVVGHHQRLTGHQYLCVAGGVGQNSTMNGRLLCSGLFQDVFVSPSAADSGCAFGAALAASHELDPGLARPRNEHVYWGSKIPDSEPIQGLLRPWERFIEARRMGNTAREAAALMANGAVIGWVQGRSEFGPRALGNRSILADPRVASHKDTINAMIKKREGYRPFAPSVLEEEVERFFVVPGRQKSFPFMTFVLPVREEMRSSLAAITHVDGSARLQTVSRATNPEYWELIRAFGDLTGIPMLLNTSFNNNAEPIVDSVTDALVCFLTSGLNHLVVGDFLVSKKCWAPADLLELNVTLPLAAKLVQEDRYVDYQTRRMDLSICWNYDNGRSRPISAEVLGALKRSDGTTSLRSLLPVLDAAGEASFADEVFELWSDRWVALSPV